MIKYNLPINSLWTPKLYFFQFGPFLSLLELELKNFKTIEYIKISRPSFKKKNKKKIRPPIV